MKWDTDNPLSHSTVPPSFFMFPSFSMRFLNHINSFPPLAFCLARRLRLLPSVSRLRLLDFRLPPLAGLIGKLLPPPSDCCHAAVRANECARRIIARIPLPTRGEDQGRERNAGPSPYFPTTPGGCKKQMKHKRDLGQNPSAGIIPAIKKTDRNIRPVRSYPTSSLRIEGRRPFQTQPGFGCNGRADGPFFLLLPLYFRSITAK